MCPKIACRPTWPAKLDQLPLDLISYHRTHPKRFSRDLLSTSSSAAAIVKQRCNAESLLWQEEEGFYILLLQLLSVCEPKLFCPLAESETETETQRNSDETPNLHQFFPECQRYA